MIVCVGIGPGSLEYLTHKAGSLLKDAEVVAGFDSVLNVVAPVISQQALVVPMGYKNQTERLAQVAQLHHEGKRCVIAFMGDVHFSGFQYLDRVERACGHEVETVPGISSAQILASKAKVCFDETTFLTFHRRGDLEPFKRHLITAARDGRNIIAIPHPWQFMPQEIAKFLLEAVLPTDHQVEVWENLTGIEAPWYGNLLELSQSDHTFSDMSIMLIRCLKPVPRLESLV